MLKQALLDQRHSPLDAQPSLHTTALGRTRKVPYMFRVGHTKACRSHHANWSEYYPPLPSPPPSTPPRPLHPSPPSPWKSLTLSRMSSAFSVSWRNSSDWQSHCRRPRFSRCQAGSFIHPFVVQVQAETGRYKQVQAQVRGVQEYDREDN